MASTITFRPAINLDGNHTRVLVNQDAAVDPSRFGDRVGNYLGFDEQRAVDAALRLVLAL
ncbi:hypothetical protein [Kocuria sp.]|uniref:hypothetical protein n=1 Tax=Kocuria sp. TaxID=1871328 RepID=UPI0026E112EE|nr:hypothetical protein [Kocuria sp.]MDO5617244.1 hypothetical protein [Kocuria sp.]